MTRLMHLYKYNIVIALLLLLRLNVNAQHVDPIFLDQPRILNYNNELPKNLLSSRSAVFIACPYGPLGKNWKDIAVEAHKSFRKSGIDAVAYYHFKDILAGTDASRAFAEDLKKREIKNIVIINNNVTGSLNNFTVIITPFTGDMNFFAHSQSAWKGEDKELIKILENLYRNVASNELEKSNFLIIDQPEFFEDTRINKGKRFEIFLSDLKLDKLAVPKFEAGEIPAKKGEGPLNKNAEESLVKLKEEAEQNNRRLEGIMGSYPFKYEFVDGSRTEEQLRRAGFQYILMRLHTSDITIKDLLNYPSEKNPSQTAVRYKKGQRTEPVYKYYIRHIHSGDIYLGSGWDAAETWHEALENHIHHMRRELKIMSNNPE